MRYSHQKIVGLAASLVALDQTAKYFTRVYPDATAYIWKPWLGLEYLRNTGIAFGLSLPQSIVIFLTPFIILALCLYAIKQTDTRHQFALILIVCGAVSNFIDRILWSATIDYIRVFTAVINLADIYIALGIIALFYFYACQNSLGRSTRA